VTRSVDQNSQALAGRPDQLERRLRECLDALGPAPRAELLSVCSPSNASAVRPCEGPTFHSTAERAKVAEGDPRLGRHRISGPPRCRGRRGRSMMQPQLSGTLKA